MFSYTTDQWELDVRMFGGEPEPGSGDQHQRQEEEGDGDREAGSFCGHPPVSLGPAISQQPLNGECPAGVDQHQHDQTGKARDDLTRTTERLALVQPARPCEEPRAAAEIAP